MYTPTSPEYTNPNPLANPTKKDPSVLQILPVVKAASPLASPITAANVASPVDPATMGIVEGINDLLMTALPLLFPGIGAGVAVADAALMKLTPWLIAVLQKKTFDLGMLRAMTADLNSFGASFPNQPGYVNAFSGGSTPAPGTGNAPPSPGSVIPVSMTVVIGGSTITITADTFDGLLASLVKLGTAVSASPTSPVLTPATA